jgi:hypothetical protein
MNNMKIDSVNIRKLNLRTLKGILIQIVKKCFKKIPRGRKKRK